MRAEGRRAAGLNQITKPMMPKMFRKIWKHYGSGFWLWTLSGQKSPRQLTTTTSIMPRGSVSSTAPASLEKRLSTRPAGEESKKEEGARSNRENMSE